MGPIKQTCRRTASQIIEYVNNTSASTKPGLYQFDANAKREGSKTDQQYSFRFKFVFCG
jgi:hypothetical protein